MLAVAVLAVAASAALAPVAHSAWLVPSSRVDNTAEGFFEVTGGDIGSGGRTVVLFPQTREGQAASDAALFANTSSLGAPTWQPTPVQVALPNGVGAGIGSSYRLAVAPDGTARGVFVSSNQVFLFSWPVGGSPSVAPTPVMTGIATQSVRMVMGGDGAAHVAANTTGTATVKYLRIAPDGTPGAEQALGAGTEPDLAVSAAGVAVSYTKTAGTVVDVVLRRKLAGATEFSPESAGIVNVTDPADQGAVAIDGSGDITVAFRETPARAGGVAPNPTQTRYARWLASAPGPATPRTLSDPPASPTPAASGPNHSSPRIAVDGSGRATFVWSAAPPEGGGSNLNASELVNGVRLAVQNLGEGTRPALGVSPSGLAVLVFHSPNDINANAIGMERQTGNLFGARTTLQLSGSGAGLSPSSLPPRLVVSAAQADAYFLQRTGTGVNAKVMAVAARNLLSTAPPASQPVAEARGCPPANNTVAGTAGDDLLTGTNGNDNLLGLEGNDRLNGVAGNDCIRGEGGSDDASGGAGNDDLNGGDGGDFLRGDTGADVLVGETGADVLAGGDGADRLDGGADSDRLSAGAGNDEADAGEGNDRIFLSSGNDLARGGEGDDLISAGAGKDTVLGEGGDDRLTGTSGRNDLRGGDGNDRLRGGSGRDALFGGDGLDRIFGLSGADLLIGGGGIDIIKGGSGNDRIYGRDDNDRLRGGEGNDKIVGGLGDDRIWGDDGRDRISASSGDDLIHAADGNTDRINCGRGKDRVIADRRDRISRNCERVRFRSAAP
ncbi:MAG TPA: hypothetical protein VNT32_11370 [Thermoleophilaceae bacterium]|nr:hypothetical protein [Thermoleophilaceae bacterium]